MNKEIIIDTLGFGGVGLFTLKVVIHFYIKRVIDKKYSFSNFGRFTDPMLLLPIFEDVKPNLQIVKKIGNILYAISIIMIVIFETMLNLYNSHK